MESQKTTAIHCPQCGSVCNKTETPLTHEHSIECRVCGYQEIKTTSNIEKFKGYGSLVVNNTVVLFHEPIQFDKEQEILKSITENQNANFIKWTDEHGLTVLKGELPQEFTDEEIEQKIAEEEYWKSLRYSSSYNSDDYVDF